MSFCICCHSSLLRHVRHSDIYWFCPNCRQEMPSLEIAPSGNPLKAQVEEVVFLKAI